MSHHENRNVPGKMAVRIVIQVNQIGFGTSAEVHQPLAGLLHIDPGIVHPTQFEATLMNFCVGDATQVITLSSGLGTHYFGVIVSR